MRVGITRTAEQLQDLSAIAATRAVEVVPLPLTQIVQLPFELPRGFSIGEDDWIIFTSANGVQAFFAGVSRLPIRIPHACRIAAVGKKTRKAVEEQGFDVSLLPNEPYGEALVREFIEQCGSEAGKVIYARAEQVQSDPEAEFKAAKIDYYSVVCYRSVDCDLDPAVIERFEASDVVLFTAPSAVRAYASQFGPPAARPIAIGKTTTRAMKDLGWNRVMTMPEPDIEKVLELV